jgi:GntR family transcriptional regulator
MSLELKLKPESNLPPFRQIAEQLRAAILGGALPAGTQLPSVREMAADLSVNPLTVARAVNELEAAGLIESRWGKGNFVRAMTPAALEEARARAFQALMTDFLQAAERLGFTPVDAAKATRAAASALG